MNAHTATRSADGTAGAGLEDVAWLAMRACHAAGAGVITLGEEGFRVVTGINWPAGVIPFRAEDLASRKLRVLRDGLPDAGMRFCAWVPLLASDGGVTGAVAVADVLSRDLDEEQREALTRLASLAASRIEVGRMTRELLHAKEQQRQSRRLEAIGRLAGGVAHDFNNLLTAILGYCDLALTRLPESHEARRDLDEIRNAACRATDVTRQLLAFSRKQILKPQVLDLNSLVREAEPMLRRVIGEDIELEAHLDTTLRNVQADPAQMQQVIINLVVNARDAMPRGGRVTVRTAAVRLEGQGDIPAGDYSMISVADTGVGMDAETITHIFEPFFTTKPKGQGTGLGLATVYGIVRQCEGQIRVVSRPGWGTTFRVYLPRCEGRVTAARRAASASIAQAPAAGSGRILLVEDDAAVRCLLGTVLGRAGYEVIEACDAEEAMRAAERDGDPIQLVVTDIVLPRMSGPEFAEWIVERRPGTKVLLMSGYADADVTRRIGAERRWTIMRKPFSAASLTGEVRTLLQQA